MISTRNVNFEEMKQVLQNGSELSLYSYYQIRLNLLRLAEKYHYHFRQLIESCLLPQHTLLESTKWTLTQLSLMNGDAIDENTKNIILNDLEEIGIKYQLQQLLWNITGDLPTNKSWRERIFECDNYLLKLKNKIAEPFFKENKNISKQLIVEAIRDISPIKFTFLSKFWDFLKDNKYPLLLTAIAGFCVYDYYHENYIGKAYVSLKNKPSMWNSHSNSPSDEKNKEENPLQDIGITVVPY